MYYYLIGRTGSHVDTIKKLLEIDKNVAVDVIDRDTAIAISNSPNKCDSRIIYVKISTYEAWDRLVLPNPLNETTRQIFMDEQMEFHHNHFEKYCDYEVWEKVPIIDTVNAIYEYIRKENGNEV